MNGVLGMGQLMLDDELSSEQRDRARTMVDSGMALLAIIDDILDFSRIEAGRLEIEHAEFNLRDMMDEIVALQVLEARRRDIGLSLSFSEQAPRRFFGDPTRIRQILTNLLGNAIKFTSKGYIRIEADAGSIVDGQCMVSLSVEDTGIGMDRSKLDRIFEEFSQVDQSTTRLFSGTGLGLAICHRLCELMGGSIHVESMLGKGSTFTVNLPLEVAETQVEKAPELIEVSSHLSGLHVLIAEDNRVNQMVATQALKKLGCSTEIAENGKMAVEKVASTIFDIILMDLHMPEMDGLEATREIRERNLATEVPIIALTANVRDEDREMCAAAGMNDFLSKPVRIPEMREVLERNIPVAAD